MTYCHFCCIFQDILRLIQKLNLNQKSVGKAMFNRSFISFPTCSYTVAEDSPVFYHVSRYLFIFSPYICTVKQSQIKSDQNIITLVIENTSNKMLNKSLKGHPGLIFFFFFLSA